MKKGEMEEQLNEEQKKLTIKIWILTRSRRV
jgi:hypothetical protein